MISDQTIEFLKQHAVAVKVPVNAVVSSVNSPAASVQRASLYGIDDDNASLLTAETALFDHTNEENREATIRRNIQEQRRIRQEQQGDSHRLAQMPVVSYPLSRRDKVAGTRSR
jgi:hypothetical protein